MALEADSFMQKLGPRERQHINSVLDRVNLGERKRNNKTDQNKLKIFRSEPNTMDYFSPFVGK